MIGIFKRALVAIAGFYHVTSKPNVSMYAGVDVVEYDQQYPLADALLYALEMGLPLLQMRESTLLEQVEFEEEINLQQEHTGQLSYREVRISRAGTWWSEWQKSSSCLYASPDTVVSQFLEVGASYNFSIEQGPLTWESVSPLLNINGDRDLKLQSQANVYVRPDQEVGQVWTQAQYTWFDAEYRNCTLNVGGSNSPECGEFSQLFHGDAPHKLESAGLHMSISYGRDKCEC